MILGRRQFLAGALAAASRSLWSEDRYAIRVASNQGAENSALQQMLTDSGFAKRFSLDIQLVESRSVSGPMESLLSGEADVSMISAFAGILPAISQGKPLRLIDAAMRLPALAVYSTRNDIQTIGDLPGKTVGVGPLRGLLHILMLALLRKKGIDASKVSFVNVGSNAQVLEAVAAGKVDAGLSGVAGIAGDARVLQDGCLWQELPEYTYELSYASERALREKPEALARCVAVYRQLYRYLSSQESEPAYLQARRHMSSEGNLAEGEAVWNFIQQHHPYAAEPGIGPERVDYLQRLNMALGIQTSLRAYDQVVDLNPARSAARMLSKLDEAKGMAQKKQL